MVTHRKCVLTALSIGCVLSFAACKNQDIALAEAQQVELDVEVKRLTTELALVTDSLRELQNAQSGFITQQVVGQPVKFTGGGDTLQDVLDRKVLRCGGNADLPGFGYLDPDSSEYVGFDIDVCRAIGAAVLGEQGASNVQIVPLTSKLRFASLQSGEIDVLVRSKGDDIKKLSELRDKSLCVQSGSTSESNVLEYFDKNDINVEVRAFDDRIAALNQYDDKACDAYTGDKSSLIAQQTLLSQPDDHMILVSDISREPLGPVVRHDDDNWLDVVTWTIQCMLTGEFHGISQENIAALRASDETTLFEQIGVSKQLGRKIGLADNFCYEVIRQVGNYKDVYERHLGPDTEFNLPRGLNALYHDGGLHYPLPMN